MSATLTQTFHTKLCSILLQTRNEPEFCDVTFMVGDIGDDQKEFNANRMLLSMVSDVFKAMLYGKMKESEQNCTVTITDVEPNAFGAMLDFIYLNDPKLSADNIVAVAKIADKYQISLLIELCHRYLPKCLQPKNFCTILNDMMNNNLKAYVWICKQEYIKRSMPKVCGACKLPIFSNDTIVHLDLETLLYVLQWDCIRLSEDQLWQFIMTWIGNKLQKNDSSKKRKLSTNSSSPKGKRQKLNDGSTSIIAITQEGSTGDNDKLKLLAQIRPFIRFGLMPAVYFVEHVKPQNFLSDKDIAGILCYITVKKGECGAFSTKKRFDVLSRSAGRYNCTICGKRTYVYC